MNQASLFDARQARDEGIAKVEVVNVTWLGASLALLSSMKAEGHTTATGEGIRIWLTAAGIVPSSPHAWGMLIRTAMKRGLIKDTGRQVQMFTEKSHARRTPLWEIV